MKRNIIILGIVLGALCFAVGFVIGFVGGAFSTKASREKINAAMELHQKLKDTGGFVLVQKENLHKLYPALKVLKTGKNIVEEKYLDSFIISPDTDRHNHKEVSVNMSNKSDEDVKPHFETHFLDKYGFVLDAVHIRWLKNTIKKGETKTDQSTISDNIIDKAMYYMVVFEK